MCEIKVVIGIVNTMGIKLMGKTGERRLYHNRLRLRFCGPNIREREKRKLCNIAGIVRRFLLFAKLFDLFADALDVVCIHLPAKPLEFRYFFIHLLLFCWYKLDLGTVGIVADKFQEQRFKSSSWTPRTGKHFFNFCQSILILNVIVRTSIVIKPALKRFLRIFNAVREGQVVLTQIKLGLCDGRFEFGIRDAGGCNFCAGILDKCAEAPRCLLTAKAFDLKEQERLKKAVG